MSSWTSWLRQCLRLSLSPMPVIFLKISGKMFCKISFNWNMSDVLIMIKLELWVLGKKSTEVRCHFCYIISRVQTIKLLMTVDADSDHLSQVMVIRLLLCKLAIFFSFNIENLSSFLCCTYQQLFLWIMKQYLTKWLNCSLVSHSMINEYLWFSNLKDLWIRFLWTLLHTFHWM